ncbi:hypothetical protein [uncultured Microbacterium sp.]|uniref:Uncharacterized protein n=1 Tax=uncultured Microbacterium sp. TaxID=191216 RepID=A0A1Y5PDC5_9MICO|nr:hypothetical protein [uncultured Microbacterium sp.]SBS73918.1 exported hypothetical protein [uncultured Microbacterium sp.]
MNGQLGSVRSWLRVSVGLAALSVALVLGGCASSGNASSPPPAASASGAPAASETASAEPTTAASPEQQYCERAALAFLDESAPAVATSDEVDSAASALGVELPGTPECSVTHDVSTGGRGVLVVWVGDESIAPTLVADLTAKGFTVSQEPTASYTITVFTSDEVEAGVSPVGKGNGMSVWGQPWPDDFVTLLHVFTP